MQAKLEKENVRIIKKELSEISSIWIEQDILVPDIKPDILKVIKVSTIPFITKTECGDNKIKIFGRLNSYILYRSVDETNPYKTITYSYDFNDVIKVDDVKKNSSIIIKPLIRNVIFQVPNERKVSLKNELFLDIKIKEEDNISLLTKISDVENIKENRKEIILNNIVSTNIKEIDIREEIVLDDKLPDINEIAFENHSVQNIEYKKNYNKIIVKGDLEGYLVYTTKNTDKILNKEEFSIPFTTFFELPEIKDNYDIKIDMEEVNFVPRKNTDNVTSSSVIVDALLKCKVLITEEKKINSIVDFYSLDKNENITKKNEKIECKCNEKKISHDLNHTFKDVVSETDNVVEFNVNRLGIVSKIIDNKCICEGILKLSILVEDSKTKEINCKNLELEIKHIDNIQGKNIIFNNLKLKDIKLTKEEGNIILKGELEIIAKECKLINLNIFDNIELNDLDTTNLDDIVLYIVKENDTLFDIAKRYKTDKNNILKLNEIKDPQKLELGKKLLIIR